MLVFVKGTYQMKLFKHSNQFFYRTVKKVPYQIITVLIEGPNHTNMEYAFTIPQQYKCCDSTIFSSHQLSL